MPTMESRIGYLEGRAHEQSNVLQDLRVAVRHVDDKMSRQFTWLVGILLTMFITLLATILTR
jgi:uncharacterized coiled-coil protein SlyX